MEFRKVLDVMGKGGIVKRVRQQRNPQYYFVGFDGFGNLGEGILGKDKGFSRDHVLTREEVDSINWEMMTTKELNNTFNREYLELNRKK